MEGLTKILEGPAETFNIDYVFCSSKMIQILQIVDSISRINGIENALEKLYKLYGNKDNVSYILLESELEAGMLVDQYLTGYAQAVLMDPNMDPKTRKVHNAQAEEQL